MAASRKSRVLALAVVLLVDAAALVLFYLFMPSMRRPFEVLAAILAVLGVVTALAVKGGFLRGLALTVASIAATVFMLEMAEKFFGITDLATPRAAPIAVGDGGKYAWDADNLATYLAAKDRARADGIDPEALADHFAGDVFDNTPKDALVVSHRAAGSLQATMVGTKKFYLTNTPLGYEHNPDNRSRDYGAEPSTGRMIFDVLYTINSEGYRQTPAAGEAEGGGYVFLGDSFTFGVFLNDDQTLPYYFSRAGGGGKVLNLGVSGWGPHHALRVLELARYKGLEKDNPLGVKGVYFGLIDTHADRVSTPTTKFMTAPYYVLDGDRPVFRPRQERGGVAEMFLGMMEKSRIYPTLRDRLTARLHQGDVEYKWRLTAAVLAEIDSICRERFGVPLTVVYWDDNEKAAEALRARGLDLVRVRDVFPEGGDWRTMAIKYMVFDTHPSAHANKLLAEYLAGREQRRGQ